MQIHEAAAQYLTHRQALDDHFEGSFINVHVWRVLNNVKGYYLQLHPVVSELPADGSNEACAYARTITRQRGGTRYFKTLDAVVSALRQIGQPVMPLDDLG